MRGHYQLFEVDQSHISGVTKTLDSDNVGKPVFYMICGWMTPKQRDIVRRFSAVDTKLYMDVLSWFIQKSGHCGYIYLCVPDSIPSPIVMEDKNSTNNTDPEVNPDVEHTFGGGTFNFSYSPPMLSSVGELQFM